MRKGKPKVGGENEVVRSLLLSVFTEYFWGNQIDRGGRGKRGEGRKNLIRGQCDASF